MQTLSYGFKLPETGDRGSVFYPALEDDIQQINDHNHDGANSAPITSSAISHVTQSITAVGWVSVGLGTYSQLVTMPGLLQFDQRQIFFRDSTGETVYPRFVKASANTYTLYTNDNTLAVTAHYL